MGSAVCLYIEEWMEKPPLAIILTSAFTSISDVVETHSCKFLANMMSNDHFNSLARIGNCRAPTMINHGEMDELVPISHGEKLFK